MKPGSETKNTEAQVSPEAEPVITDIQDFYMKAQTASLMNEDYLVVNERVFNAIGRGVKSPYLTYGNPGIKVYLEGTKEKCDSFDTRRLD
jgi:hypothetical protein